MRKDKNINSVISIPLQAGEKSQSENESKRFLTAKRQFEMTITFFFLIAFFLNFSKISFTQNSNCWPSFRANQELTGYTPIKIGNSFKLQWSFKTEDAIKSSPVVCYNQIFIGSNDGFLYSLSLDGKLIWKFNAGNSIEAPPLILDNVIYFGTLQGDFFALEVNTGKLKW